MSRTLNILLRNTDAETRKLWKRSAGLLPLEAIPVDQFTSRLAAALHAPTEIATALSSVARYADIARRLVSRRAYHRKRRRQRRPEGRPLVPSEANLLKQFQPFAAHAEFELGKNPVASPPGATRPRKVVRSAVGWVSSWNAALWK